MKRFYLIYGFFSQSFVKCKRFEFLLLKIEDMGGILDKHMTPTLIILH